MFTVTHRLPMGVVLFTATELASANSFQSLEHENVFGLRLLTWILLAALLTALVWLWQTAKPHRPFHEKKAPTDPMLRFAFIGILAVGFIIGVLFQLIIGVRVISIASRWLDVDGQILAVVLAILALIFGVRQAIANLPRWLHWLSKCLRTW